MFRMHRSLATPALITACTLAGCPVPSEPAPEDPAAIEVAFDGAATIVALAAGEQHSALLAEDGTVWTSGNNSDGELGFPESTGLLEAFAPVPDVEDVVDVSAGSIQTFLLYADGTAEAPELPWRQRNSPMGGDLLEESERLMGGSVAELPEEYAMSSPITYVSPEVPPTMLITPGHDLFVGPEDNRRLAARLDAAGVPHRHLEIPWSEHMFDLNWGGSASQVTRHGLDGFLDEHLAASP